MIKATDERLDAVVDLLQGYTNGLNVDDIGTKLGMSQGIARRVLQVLQRTGRVAPAHLGRGRVIWTTARNAGPLRARLRAESQARDRERQRQRRADGLGMFNPDNVPDLPVVRRIHTCWPPLRVAPGPTSVFDLANHA